MAYKANEKGHLLTEHFQKPMSKIIFLANHLPKSSQILCSLHQAYGIGTAPAGAQKSTCLVPKKRRQPGAGLLSERQPTSCLVCFSVLGLFRGTEQGETGQTPSCSPFPRVSNILHSILCMCRRSDSTAKKGCNMRLFLATGVINNCST